MAEQRFASMTSANVKMMRAQEHIEAFERDLDSFRKSARCVVVCQCEVESRQQVFVVDEVEGPPAYRLSFYLGDALYNMRAALDHLVWDLVISCGNSPDNRNAFPLCDDAEEWRRYKSGRLGGITDSAIRAEIRGCQPCFGDNQFRNRHLRLLEELSNIDKHRHFNLMTMATEGAFMDVPSRVDRTQPRIPDWFVHRGAIERGTVLARIPSEYVNVDFRPFLGVAFRDGPAARESALEVIIAIREMTRLTLDRFVRFLPKVVRGE